MSTETTVTPWHPLDNPECTNCHGLSRPVRPRRPCADCGLVHLKIDRQTKIRAHLRRLHAWAHLPKNKLAQLLNMDVATFWRAETGRPMSEKTARHVQGIVYIKREGAFVHVIHDLRGSAEMWDKLMQQHAARERRRRDPHEILVQQLASRVIGFGQTYTRTQSANGSRRRQERNV